MMEKRIISIAYGSGNHDVSIALRKSGRELLLLLHGLGCSKESFRDIWFRDEFNDYSIISLDFLGFGDSSKPDKFSYRMEHQASVCAEVMKKISSDRIHIVAHSMGGAVGLLLPASLLNSVLTFANLEGNLISEDCGIATRKTISVSFHKFENELLPHLRLMSKSLGEGRFFLDSAFPLGFYKSAESLLRWSESGDLLSRFKKLRCKKSYFYGEKNSDMDVLHRLNAIEKVMIGRSGHFMMNDNPDEFYSRLKIFLNTS
ncbi:MAG: alpha/beta hydrolase [Thermodesulfobacteriota bacterium]|nr:alpha/beta hydrolase [Thermodesulfobacteriota bacterium]